jgi:hypothetical protein
MPSWLIENSAIVYLLLAFGLIVSLAFWWRTRRRGFLIAAGILAALVIGFYLLDRAFETDGKQMVRKVQEVASAVSANNLDAAFRNVSDSFNRGGLTKKQFRDFCDSVRSTGKVTDVVVWALDPIEVSRPDRKGTIAFRFKVKGSWGETAGTQMAHVYFVLDADNEWRIRSFDVYDVMNNSKTPLTVPGLPGGP